MSVRGLAVILGASMVCACGVWALTAGGGAASDDGWKDYEDANKGLAVKFPSSWQRAGFPMFARIGNPRSILSVSTFPIPPGASGREECGYVPSQVQEGVGRAGAAVLVYELYREPGGFGPKFVRQTPKRPAGFQLDKEHGQRMSGASDVWLFHFKDQGRLLTAAALLGPDASAELRRGVVGVLDSLRFDSWPRGGVS